MLMVYICFLAGGAVLPFISFFLGSMSDGMHGDVDVGTDANLHTDLHMDLHSDIHTDLQADLHTGLHTDTGGSMFSIGLLPTSLMSLSALAITLGAVGSIMTYSGKGKVITLVAAIVAGYLASVIVQTIIKSLRKFQKGSTGTDENELMLYDGKIVDTILPGQLGTVSFVTLNKILVSYPARCADEGMRLETGRIVKVLEINNGIFIVEAKNKYE